MYIVINTYILSLSPIPFISLALDDDVDWVSAGAVTPVKDQGSSGTCGYFSSISVMEGINVIQGGNELVEYKSTRQLWRKSKLRRHQLLRARKMGRSTL